VPTPDDSMPGTAPPHVPAALVVDWDFNAPPGGEHDVHLAWKRLQDEANGDIVWSTRNGGHWIFLRAENIHKAYADFAHFSSQMLFIPRERGDAYHGLPNTIDPPQSLGFRALLTPGLAPRSIKALEPVIRDKAISLIESFKDRGECEFIAEYASKLPVSVFMMLCDLPMEDADELKYLADQVPRPDGSMTMEEAANKIAEYLAPYLEHRRAKPGNDLLSKLATGKVGDRQITFDEAMNLCSNTMFGGLDTVSVTHGFAMHFLATHPEVCRLIAGDAAMIPNAVDEIFRRFAIASAGRLVQEDIEIGGVTLKKGDLVLLPTMLHGLDERAYADPLRFDIHRAVGATSTFGNGHHQCPGRFLARTELSITLKEWLQRIPTFELDPDVAVRMISGQVVAINNLPLQWRN
jgi:cytochrome P450